MLRQHARAMRICAGSLWLPKYSNNSSITALTTPEASMAGVWQCAQPWVWTILVMLLPVPPTGNQLPRERSSPRSGWSFVLSLTRNSTLFLVVQRRYPPQYLSARSHSSPIYAVLTRRAEPIRTEYNSAPDSDTCTRTPGSRISWYFHLPKFSLITGGKNLSYFGGPISVIRSFMRLFGSKAIFRTS